LEEEFDWELLLDVVLFYSADIFAFIVEKLVGIYSPS
jgi:hypothetical protein